MVSKSLAVCVLLAVVTLVVSKRLGGFSTALRHQDDNGNYHFGYDITDHTGGRNTHKEVGRMHGKSNVKHGAYTLHDVDGRSRVVEYVADDGGFRAAIRSNEPGVGKHGSADAAMSYGGR